MIKTFETPDMVNETPSGRARAEVVSITQGRLVRATTQPGFRWSDDIKPLTGAERCTMRHLGTVLDGTYHFHFDDNRAFDVPAGGVYDIAADDPHDEWVVGDARCRVIDIYFLPDS